MATIVNATIEDVAPTATGLAMLRISCTIAWTAQELSDRRTHNMEIYLWADDAITDTPLNAHLFNPTAFLNNPIIPASTSDPLVFTPTIQAQLLNEDDRIFNNEDEIYANLRLQRPPAKAACHSGLVMEFAVLGSCLVGAQPAKADHRNGQDKYVRGLFRIEQLHACSLKNS